MKSLSTDAHLILCLRFGAFCCFAGWTWAHWYWEGPYGALLWSDGTYSLAESLGLSWDQFVGTGADDGFVQKWVSRLFWPYAACMVLSLSARPKAWWHLAGLVVGSGLLAVLSYAKYVAAQYQPPMFLEHGGQMLMPIVLVLALQFGPRHRSTILTACLAFVATFAGHGSYAVDWWPTPPNFYAMTSVILGVDYETAKSLLLVAGMMDFVVCIGILVPFLRRSAALYGAVWGLLTALARPVAGMSWGLIYWGADQFVHETVLRAPHFVLPLFLFLVWRPDSYEPVHGCEPALPGREPERVQASK
ncbi:MAG: hypothetical protein AAGD07_19470 [Planctomycetota bacterium]